MLRNTKLFLFFSLASLLSCTTTKREDVTTDSTQSSQSYGNVEAPSLAEPDTGRRMSVIDSLHQGEPVPPTIDGQANPPGMGQAMFRYIGQAQTGVKNVSCFVISADREDSVLTIHTVVQNGLTGKEGLTRTAVEIKPQQLLKVSLVDDATGKSYPVIWNSTVNTATGIKWWLDPGARQDLVMSFRGVPATARSVTLTIPAFTTVGSIPVAP
jgi:hypothetical protein